MSIGLRQTLDKIRWLGDQGHLRAAAIAREWDECSASHSLPCEELGANGHGQRPDGAVDHRQLRVAERERAVDHNGTHGNGTAMGLEMRRKSSSLKVVQPRRWRRGDRITVVTRPNAC